MMCDGGFLADGQRIVNAEFFPNRIESKLLTTTTLEMTDHCI